MMELLVSSERQGYVKKAAIFLFAVAFHVIGFYVLLHAKFHYRIYQYGPPVAVLFAPPDIVKIPRLPRKLTEAARPSAPVIVRPGQGVQPTPETSAKPGQAQGQGLPGQGAAGGGAGQGGQAGGTGGPGGAAENAGQALSLASGFGLTFPSGSALNLSKPTGNPLESYLNPRGYEAGGNVDFSKYLRSGISSLLPSGPNTGKPGGGRGGGGVGGTGQAGGGSVAINVRAYDLGPWANVVLNRIQKNWSVSHSGEGEIKGEVWVSALISKSGELLGAEIELSSKVETLDQAALKAVNSSGPFPALPANFPDGSLAMDFVFQYGY